MRVQVFLAFLMVVSTAFAEPAPLCRALFEKAQPITTLANLENQKDFHRFISRSGLTRDEAATIISELVSTGVFGGEFHEIAYTMITKPEFSLTRATRQQAHLETVSGWTATNFSRGSLKRLAKKFNDPSPKAQIEARELGYVMAEFMMEFIETNVEGKRDRVSSWDYTKNTMGDLGNYRLEVFTSQADAKKLAVLSDLLKRPQARKLLFELYAHSVSDIANYAVKRSAGFTSKLAQFAIMTPVAFMPITVAGGSMLGFASGVLSGSWEIILPSLGMFGASMPLHHIDYAKHVSKLTSAPRLWLTKRAQARLQGRALSPQNLIGASTNLQELVKPYKELRTDVIYQRMRNLGYEFTAGQEVTQAELANIKAVADSHIHVAGFAVSQLQRQIAYTRRMVDLSEEFLETGFFSGGDVTMAEVDQRWSHASAIRNKLSEIELDANYLFIEINDRLTYIRTLREELESLPQADDHVRKSDEISKLRESEVEIEGYLQRFRKEFDQDLRPGLNAMESALRKGLIPIQSRVEAP